LAGIYSGRPDLWRHRIDRHVFLWATEKRRDGFLRACVRQSAGVGASPRAAPAILEIATDSLLANHGAVAFFSRINSGSTVLGGARTRRDETTLRPIDAWRGEQAAELAIRGPVPLAGLLV
jgi:uncharacterized protein DUF7002